MIKVVEITSPGCSHCAAAKKILEEVIRPQFPDVSIEYISVTSPEGMELVGKLGIMSSPGVIVNGELFSVGGLNKEKLIAKIKELRTIKV